MSIYNMFFDFDIQLFGEGAGGGDGGTGAGDAGAVSAEVAPQHQQKGVKKNPLADVVYGKAAEEEEAPAAEAAETTPAAEPSADRSAQFDALIKGDYKDLFNQKVNEIVRQRLKGGTETVEKFQKLTPMLSELAKRYGKDAGDIDGILEGFDEDSSLYETEAAERGLDVEQYMQVRKMQRQNESLQAQLNARMAQEEVDQTVAAWQREGETVKQVYPTFDLQTELGNPEFAKLLQSNIPMKTAFEVIHKDEIMPAAMQYASQQGAAKVANSIAAGQKRPNESAMSNRPAVNRKSDVSQLTKADRAEIARRVARGEKISF